MNSKVAKSAVLLPILLASSPSFSQTEGDDLFDDLFAEEEIETISITGFRSRLKANLDQKRYSETVLDGISAEDIGKFPDKNIADSLQRVTGVSITRDFGEGEKISIRGTAPGLNRTLLNGQNVATADWFVLDNPTRSFNFSLLASEMVSSLEVYKSPQADIDEGSIGGTVVLKTRRPLSVESGTAAASIQMAYSDKTEEWDPQLSGFYSWHNENKTFGALLSVISQERSVRRDGFEILGYEQRDINGTDAYVPSLIGSALFEQTRERNGFMFTTQFKPVDALLFTFNALHSKLDADNTNHNMLTVPAWEFDADKNPAGPNFDNVQIDDSGTLVGWEYGDANRPGAVLDVAERKSYSETSSYDLDVMYDPGSYQLHFQIGFTEAEGGTTKDVFSEYLANSRSAYDISQKVPQVSFPDIDINNAELFKLDFTKIDSKPQEDEETYAQVDYKYYLDHDFFSTVKMGLKYRDHTKSQYKMATRWASGAIADLNHDLADFPGGSTPNDFMDGIAKGGSLVDYPLLDTGAFEREVYSAANSSMYSTTESKSDFFDINEEITAIYGMVNFEGEDYRGNFGVRYVETDLDSQYWDFAIDGITTDSVSYDDTLPSFNINYDLAEDMVLRFAAAQVMSRPEYIEITGSRSLNPDSIPPSGQGGNPDLDPFRADQLDLSYEWYFAETGLFSAALFYKDIESYIVNQTVQETYENSNGDAITYNVSLPINGDGGTNQGLEIGYQQDLWEGWGMLANYTYSDAEADDGGLIPGNSEHTYNATVYYENETLSARVSYNYRTEYFEGLDRGSELMTDGFGQMDGSISYEITENISFVLQGLNLTDEEIYKYSGTTSRPYAYYSNGRRFFVGAQLSF